MEWGHVVGIGNYSILVQEKFTRLTGHAYTQVDTP